MKNSKVTNLNDYRIEKQLEYLKQLKIEHQGKILTADEIKEEMEIVSEIIGMKFPEEYRGD